MENQWLAWAKRLHAIATSGLHFCRDDFDRERYGEVASIAEAMLASLGDVPVTHIRQLLSPYEKGYATPKIDVRGAVIRGEEVLLVREKSDGLWTLPGGFADVGLSPSENVRKEIREEASVEVSVDLLYSVRHQAKHAYQPAIRDFYKLFFLCRVAGMAEPRAGAETLEARFFRHDRLPSLSTERVLASDIEAAFAFHRQPDLATRFD